MTTGSVDRETQSSVPRVLLGLGGPEVVTCDGDPGVMDRVVTQLYSPRVTWLELECLAY